jgi:hypothetical protein
MNPSKHRVKQLRRDMRQAGLGRWERRVVACEHGEFPVAFSPEPMPRLVLEQVLDLMAARWNLTPRWGLLADSADVDDEWWDYYTAPQPTARPCPVDWVPARYRCDA